MKKLSLIALAFVVSGCNSFNGKVGGTELQVVEALFFPYKENGAVTGASVIMSNKPKLCDSLKGNRVPKNSVYMVASVGRYTAAGAVAPDVGDYTVTTAAVTQPGNYAAAIFASLDANCNSLLNISSSVGQSGLVKVQSYKAEQGGSMSGTFDITFGTQSDKTSGSFTAQYCDLTNNFPSNANCE
jgi:hypothetical protein